MTLARRALILVAVGAALASGCSASPGVETAVENRVLAPPSATPEAIREPTKPPTAPPETVGPTAAPSPAPTDVPPPPTPTAQPEGPCNAGPLALPNPDRPVYVADLDIDPLSRSVIGDLVIEFTPDLAISELYLRLWPNGPRTVSGGVSAQIDDVVLGDGGSQTPEMVSATIARVELPQPVQAGETVSLTASFSAVIPAELKSRLSGRDDYMRLGTILPILPWEPGRGWALDPATGLFAEAVSSPVADYRVTIRVPDGYDVLASGVLDGDTWQVDVARDFAISIGRFRTVTGVAMAPEPVQVTVGVHDTLDDDPNAYLVKIIDSLEQFSSRWGQYPWPSLTFALTPNLGGGIEFPTHIMQGPGTIGRTTSHEVGHMFFYSLVGNNQATEPWLDEGITSYAEFTYERVGAGAYEIPSGGIGNAAQPMTFWEERSDIYYRSVYAQTGFALLRLGAQADVDCALARYVATNAHRIATADDFIAAFEPTFPDVVARLADLGVNLGE